MRVLRRPFLGIVRRSRSGGRRKESRSAGRGTARRGPRYAMSSLGTSLLVTKGACRCRRTPVRHPDRFPELEVGGRNEGLKPLGIKAQFGRDELVDFQPVERPAMPLRHGPELPLALGERDAKTSLTSPDAL